MKKRFTISIIIISILFTMLPIASMATANSPSSNYNDSDVTWLGTTSEYKKTLEAFFDSNLRKVKVDGKYGLVDREGVWKAKPIYDEIEAYYLTKDSKETNQNKETEEIFVRGYVQAVRNGKMGLLDRNGKEVIPCKYDAVGLPAEGISRITVKKSNDSSYYIGYWSLEKGKEIVAPNKYIINSIYERSATAVGSTWPMNSGKNPDDSMGPENKGKSIINYDFKDGYAMVPIGKETEIKIDQIFGLYGKKSTYTRESGINKNLIYVQIIDKNGKEILQKPYAFLLETRGDYPQVGTYLVYSEASNKFLQMTSDAGDHIMFDTHIVSGVVGPKGVVIPAQYHGGIIGNALGWSTGDAAMTIIPKSSLVITKKCADIGIKESEARTGVINFSNKTIVPFDYSVSAKYDYENNVITRSYHQSKYKVDGSKISGSEKQASKIVNGYMALGETDGSANMKTLTGILSVKTGKIYSHENLKGIAATDVSKKDTVWVKKGSKWGLVDLNGKMIQPFEYDEVNTSAWQDEIKPYAAVSKNGKWGMVDVNGKLILPCNYGEISSKANETDRYIKIKDYATKKYGVYSLDLEKITLEPQFDTINLSFKEDGWGMINGTVSINTGNSMNALFDLDTGKKVTEDYLVLKPSKRGLFFATHNNVFGPDGKLVFSRAEDTQNYTLVVKDGKVGSIHASRLAVDGKFPTTSFVKPEPKPINQRGYLVAYPEKLIYMVGDLFDITGIIVHYEDANGMRSVVDNSKLKFYTSKTVELTQGRAFTTDGVKTIEIRYEDKKVDEFQVKVVKVGEGSTKSNILQTGDYYMQIYGKYIYPVKHNQAYSLELSDKKPEKPFNVKLVNYSEERGPEYTIAYDGLYIGHASSSNGNQLESTLIPMRWRINQYSNFSTIRDYGNQKLIVNASGEKKANGTKIIIWTSTGSAPENAKIIFTEQK